MKEDPCCKSNRSFASSGRMEFPMMRLLRTYFFKGVAKGARSRPAPQIEIPPMIKIISQKFLQFLLAFSRRTVDPGAYLGGVHGAMAPPLGSQNSIISIVKYAKLRHAPPICNFSRKFEHTKRTESG